MTNRRPRLIVLGASNVSLSLGTIVALARAQAEGPIEVIAAHGHGRSFGVPSRVMSHLLRELPSIGTCGLWSALERDAAPRTTRAIVTDVGNDLAYGFDARTIASWLERDLVRLDAAGARTALTRLPLASLEKTPAWRFRLASTLLFPGRAISRERVLGEARALDAMLPEIARMHRATLFTPSSEWYGLDPIHVRRRLRPAAYWAILGARGDAPRDARLAFAEKLQLGLSRPEKRRFLGRDQCHAQPCVRFGDGTTIAWY